MKTSSAYLEIRLKPFFLMATCHWKMFEGGTIMIHIYKYIKEAASVTKTVTI